MVEVIKYIDLLFKHQMVIFANLNAMDVGRQKQTCANFVKHINLIADVWRAVKQRKRTVAIYMKVMLKIEFVIYAIQNVMKDALDQ